MFYSFEFNKFPAIKKFYTVVRRTVWGITDQNNILIIVTEGNCCISYEGKDYTLSPGDAFFVPAGHYYERRYADDNTCTMYYIHFSLDEDVIQSDAETLSKELTSLRRKIDNELIAGDSELSYPTKIYIQSKTVFSDFDKVKNLLDGINLFSYKRRLTCSLRSSINLSAILSIISQETINKILTDSDIHSETSVPSKLKRALGYINCHYSEHISLGELAEYCNVSKQQLIRYFKQSFDTTPTNYINDYKLARAKELLFNSPGLLISEIASELGFSSQYYFTKLFTKRMGETPSAYRFRTINYEQIDKDS